MESNIPIGFFGKIITFFYCVEFGARKIEGSYKKAMEDEEEEPCVLIGNGMRLVEITHVPMGLFMEVFESGGEGGGMMGRIC